MAAPELAKFLAALRSGDADVVRQLLSHYEPFLRQIIHLRLLDGRLQHAVDTSDIFQTLLKDFLDPTRARHEPSSPEASTDLRAYLKAAVYRKIQTRRRKEHRHQSSLPHDWQPVHPESPVRQVEEQDYQQAIRARLPESERVLFDWKMQGYTWSEIAAQVGGRADTLRMRLRRALTKILGAMAHKEFPNGP